jgi:cytochrome c
MKKILFFLATAILLAIGAYAFFKYSAEKKDINVLVFSKTENFRHSSISAGKKALYKMSLDKGFTIDTTEDATIFQEKTLKDYNVVIFLNTTGDILNSAQQLEFNRWIQAGGGFVGVHAAADTEYNWPWYGQLVGAYFNGHPNNPNVRSGAIQCLDKEHGSSNMLPDVWEREDEWYNYKNINPDIKVLLNLDESSYEGGTNGKNHPIAWYHEFDGGRSWYTGLGHTEASYTEALFLKHLWGGINYAAGAGKPVDYNNASVAPEENRFVKEVLDENLFEPMELAMLPSGNILFVERRGGIKLYEPKYKATKLIHKLDVYHEQEDGLLGLALDPNYATNNWIYLYYSPKGKEAKQHLSRFVFKDDQLDLDSEKVLLEVKTQRDECCHAGGSIEFGPDGNLFLSTGDDTNPFKSDGFSPSDEQAGRRPWDAQRTSASPNDLRGKILRIKPEDDGTYSIPEGNLFPEGTAGTRPEIYVMGCRNPFRIAIDPHTKYLYWGDVGPDAGKDSLGRGPRGYDEVNQARKAGFFGWPYFIGNNYAYNQYDFATKVSSDPRDPKAPINNSVNNSGKKELPPAQPAFIWYPYAESPDFPLTGEGGRNAMAAGVFYADDFPNTDKKFPEYYDKKLFTYDWMRGWFLASTLDEEGNLLSMERFLPSFKFNNPVDVIWGPDGDIYLLEYGTLWFAQNTDARLVHLKYIAGNREPVAAIEANHIAGAAPLTVNFKGEESKDPDGDEITYEWTFEGDYVQSNEVNPSYTFEKPGTYEVSLAITDAEGLTSIVEKKILVGNDLPKVAWKINGNRSFYLDNQVLAYEIEVSDKEDGTNGNGIDPSRINVSIDYLERGSDVVEIAMGHQAMLEASSYFLGKSLMDNSDCATCHQLSAKSIGPSYREIAQKYVKQKDAIPYLSEKIMKGGGGVWGDQAMAAHPQLSEKQTAEMVKYILSLEGWQDGKKGLKAKGSYVLKDHIGKAAGGVYVLTASYTDRGGQEIGPLTSREILKLQAPVRAATNFDKIDGAMKFKLEAGQFPGVDEDLEIIVGNHEGYVAYNDIGLDGISSIELSIGQATGYMGGGTMELRIDAADGKLIAQTEVVQGLTDFGEKIIDMPIEATKGNHDLYLVFKSADENKPVCTVFKLEFKGVQMQ